MSRYSVGASADIVGRGINPDTGELWTDEEIDRQYKIDLERFQPGRFSSDERAEPVRGSSGLWIGFGGLVILCALVDASNLTKSRKRSRR